MQTRTSHTRRIHRARGWWMLVAAVLLLGAVAPRPARAAPAEPRASAADQRRARLLFFRGLQAFARQQYPDALALFLASFTIKPKSVVLYNIAMCYKALFQYRRSIAAFRRYVKRRGGKLPLWKRRQIERSVAHMVKKLGRLKLGVHPAGATVRVDGRVVGLSPLTAPVLLDPGRRTVEVAAQGYQTVRTELNVTAGQLMSMGIRLQPALPTGKVVISSAAPEARAALDGGKLRPLPLTLALRVGRHRIRVEAPGYSAQVLTVEVRPGETTRQDVGLIPLGAGIGPGLPVYKKWWFWTLVSVAVVAAGVTTGLVVWDRARGAETIDATWQLR